MAAPRTHSTPGPSTWNARWPRVASLSAHLLRGSRCKSGDNKNPEGWRSHHAHRAAETVYALSVDERARKGRTWQVP